MDKWFRFLAEERASAAGIKKSIKDLTQQGGNEGGNPTGMKKVTDPLKDKDDEDDISAPPGAPGGGSIGAPGPSLEETKQDTRPAVEPTPFKSSAQKRYKRSRRRGDIYSTIAGHKNFKKVSGPFTTDTERSGTSRL